MQGCKLVGRSEAFPVVGLARMARVAWINTTPHRLRLETLILSLHCHMTSARKTRGILQIAWQRGTRLVYLGELACRGRACIYLVIAGLLVLTYSGSGTVDTACM